MLKVFNPEETLAPKVALESTPWLKASAERSSQTYEIAGRFNKEPLLEATSVVPIKVLRVNTEEKPETWNSKFGLVPCLNASYEFNSEFEIKFQKPDLFTVELKINPTELPFNIWSPKILLKPDIKEPGIDQILLGVNVSSSQSNLQLGNQISPFSSAALIRNEKTFIWPSVIPAAALTPNQITINDFKKQINAQETCTKRNALLRAIKVLQPEVKKTVRLNNTADFANIVLLATPVVNTLGN